MLALNLKGWALKDSRFCCVL